MVRARIVPSEPAIMLHGRRKSLIVTDVHIGFEGRMAANDVFIGKNSATRHILSDLLGIIRAESPDALILLGDVKSGIGSISGQEWDEVPGFFEELLKHCDVMLVPGNHDANIQRLLPRSVSLAGPTGLVEENILLTHGHVMPSENFSHVEKIIMGHIHPIFFHGDSVLNGQRVWVSIRTDRQRIFPGRTGDLEITVIPSFNRYLYATERKSHARSISPILERLDEIKSARIVTLDGTILGNEAMLHHVI